MIFGWVEVAIVLGVLYLLESLHWLRPGQIAFVSEGRRFRARLPSAWQTRTGSPCWGPMLSFGSRFIAQAWPLAVSPLGVRSGAAFAYGDVVPEPESAPALAFDAITAVGCNARQLFVNGRPFATLPSARQARDCASRLQRLLTLAPEERGGEIDAWLCARLDIAAAAAHLRTFRAATVALRITSTLLSVFLLIGIPWFVATRPLATQWPVLLVSWLVLVGIHASLFAKAHRKLAANRTGALVRQLTLQVLVPMMAARAYVHLTQEALQDEDPIAVAACLGEHEIFAALVRWAVCVPSRETESHRLTASLAPQIDVWFLQAYGRALRRTDTGSRLQQALVPPDPDGPHSLSYCPRCRAQYVVASGHCGSCQGVDLVAFADAPTVVRCRLEALGVEGAVHGAPPTALHS